MDARRMAWAGVILAAIALTATGLHHIRCTVTVGDGARDEPGCIETYPSALVPVFAVLGLAGAALAMAGAWRLLRSGDRLRAGRVAVGLAAVALLVPTVLPVMGWASIGFALDSPTDQPDGKRFCSGSAPFPRVPFWLQTPTCLEVVEMVLVPLVLLAGVAAAIASARGSRSVLLVALGIAGLALVVHLGSIAYGSGRFASTSLVPFLGIGLAALSIPLLRSAPARSA